jgi:hypothetical protein
MFDICAIFSALYDKDLLIQKLAQTIYFQHSFFCKISFHKNLKSLETFLDTYQEVERGEDSHAREACGGEVHSASHIGHHNLGINLGIKLLKIETFSMHSYHSPLIEYFEKIFENF